MVRLKIEFNQQSPILRAISGILYVEEINFSNLSESSIELFRCKINQTNNSIGYEQIKGEEAIPTKLFNCLRPIIDIMLRSHWGGVVLDDTEITWVPMDGNDSWAELSQLQTEVDNYINRKNKGEKNGAEHDELCS